MASVTPPPELGTALPQVLLGYNIQAESNRSTEQTNKQKLTEVLSSGNKKKCYCLPISMFILRDHSIMTSASFEPF